MVFSSILGQIATAHTGLDALSFIEWWRHAMQQIEKQHRKGFNSLVVLVAWWIWKHRNACVF
jgi:hypothetical protein